MPPHSSSENYPSTIFEGSDHDSQVSIQRSSLSKSPFSLRSPSLEKRVQFQENTDISPHSSTYDLSEVNVKSFWYSREDLGTFLGDGGWNDNIRNKAKRCLLFVRELLEQQCEHQSLGIQDPKGLRQMSRACSKRTREEARKSALQTAQEVRNFWIEQ